MRPKIALFVLTFCLFAPTRAPAADWPSWRGPQQNGTADATDLVSSWSTDGENLIWHAEFTGRSTPVILNGRVFVIGRQGDGIDRREVVAAFDAENGDKIWQHAYNVFHTTIPFNRVGWASLVGDPETGYIYSHGVGGMFFCFDRDGNIVWSHSLTEEYGRISGYGGRVHTPIVDADLVIVSYLNSNWGEHFAGRHRYFAFDKKTGDVVWISTPGGPPLDTTYSVPVIAEINGKRLLIGGNADGSIYAMKVRTGEKVWGFKLSKRGINSSVVVAGDKIYAAHSEENIDNTALGRVVCIDGTGSGDITDSHEIWRYDSCFAGYTSPILNDNRLYIVDNSANMHALDAQTGQLHWLHNVGTVGKGSPIFADGKIYAPEVNGKLTVLAPGDKAAETLSTAEIHMPDGRLAEIYGSPAVAYGRLYLSTEAGVYCIGDMGDSFVVEATAAVYPRERAPSAAMAAHLQIVPAEVLAHPGEKVSFKALAYDEQGRPIGLVDPAWELAGVAGKIDQKGNLQLGQQPGGGKITAHLGELEASVRVVVLPAETYEEDFESFAVDSHPNWIAAGKKFKVQEIDGNKVLVKPPAARGLHRANAYIGAADMKDYTIQVDLLGTKKRRAVPDMGLIANRYTLDIMGYHQQLQIRTWSAMLRMAKTQPFAWEPNVWYTMKMQVTIDDGKAVIKGKVWPRDQKEPGEWTITAEDPHPNESGSPGLYGYSPAAIHYDNLKIW